MIRDAAIIVTAVLSNTKTDQRLIVQDPQFIQGALPASHQASDKTAFTSQDNIVEFTITDQSTSTVPYPTGVTVGSPVVIKHSVDVPEQFLQGQVTKKIQS